MGTMRDAVNPDNIGPEFDGGLAVAITVLADPAGQVFDVEGGNAPADQVAAAIAARVGQGMWVIGYVNETTFHELTAAMGPKGLSWTEPEHFPAPGVYLWAADPDSLIAKGQWQTPANPLAIQHIYAGTYDDSWTHAAFPATVAGYMDGAKSQWPAEAWARFRRLPDKEGDPVPPAPSPVPAPTPAPISEVVNVQLPILQQGAQGASVHSVQTLLGGIAADGIFGPVTHARVVEYQTAHHLAADGIVGLHTWGALLGAPQ